MIDNDLISREALLRKKTRMTEYDETGCGVHVIVVRAEDIENSPAVEAEPVRHGGWEWDEIDFTYTCSECKCDFDYSSMYGLFDHGFAYAGYCPNCGARMDAEVKECHSENCWT